MKEVRNGNIKSNFCLLQIFIFSAVNPQTIISQANNTKSNLDIVNRLNNSGFGKSIFILFFNKLHHFNKLFFFKLIIDAPKMRECFVRVDPNFQGLGLHIGDAKSNYLTNNLNEPRINGNNMIRKIEPNSPAELAGLKPGDRILEINDENVEDIEYFTLINKLRDSVKLNNVINLLVMNSVEYNVYKNNNIPIKSGNNFMLKIISPLSIVKSNFVFRQVITCTGLCINGFCSFNI